MRKVASVFLIVVWLILIFNFSSDNGAESSGMSEKLIKTVVSLVSDIESDSDEMNEIVEKYSFPVRKLAHFTEYFILGVIVLNCLVTFGVNKRTLIYTSLFCIIVAATDEYHQTFISGRSGNINDILLDSSGSLIGTYLVSRFYLFKEYYKKK